MRTAADGKEIKELPESALDFLIELYLRSHNLEAVEIKKIRRDGADCEAG